MYITVHIPLTPTIYSPHLAIVVLIRNPNPNCNLAIIVPRRNVLPGPGLGLGIRPGLGLGLRLPLGLGKALQPLKQNKLKIGFRFKEIVCEGDGAEGRNSKGQSGGFGARIRVRVAVAAMGWDRVALW